MNYSKMWLAGLLLAFVVAPASSREQSAGVSKRIAKILATNGGLNEQTAYKVRSVREEYEVLAALKLTPKQQSLVLKKKPYDVIEAADQTGATREIWFDVSAFYPEF